jgi:hypothetical protein
LLNLVPVFRKQHSFIPVSADALQYYTKKLPFVQTSGGVTPRLMDSNISCDSVAKMHISCQLALLWGAANVNAALPFVVTLREKLVLREWVRTSQRASCDCTIKVIT